MVKLHKDTYCALFEAIGYTYGRSGGTFKAPDYRGLFVRGLDAGRGIDPGRQLGTTQQSGAPNIKGSFDGNVDDDHMPPSPRKTGAFYTARTSISGSNGGEADCGGIIAFDASLSSSIYKDDLKEVRPANIAANYIIKY